MKRSEFVVSPTPRAKGHLGGRSAFWPIVDLRSRYLAVWDPILQPLILRRAELSCSGCGGPAAWVTSIRCRM